jgi:antitoxin (DNA-binding transcriptional repressor) of toxin-antitoxin stability system
MSTTIGIDQAQANLKDLIAGLGPQDEIVITENNHPIARLLPLGKRVPRFGSCQGMLTVLEEDEAHLQDFQDHMP